jgi:hypothetical protein
MRGQCLCSPTTSFTGERDVIFLCINSVTNISYAIQHRTTYWTRFGVPLMPALCCRVLAQAEVAVVEKHFLKMLVLLATHKNI